MLPSYKALSVRPRIYRCQNWDFQSWFCPTQILAPVGRISDLYTLQFDTGRRFKSSIKSIFFPLDISLLPCSCLWVLIERHQHRQVLPIYSESFHITLWPCAQCLNCVIPPNRDGWRKFTKHRAELRWRSCVQNVQVIWWGVSSSFLCASDYFRLFHSLFLLSLFKSKCFPIRCFSKSSSLSISQVCYPLPTSIPIHTVKRFLKRKNTGISKRYSHCLLCVCSGTTWELSFSVNVCKFYCLLSGIEVTLGDFTHHYNDSFVL